MSSHEDPYEELGPFKAPSVDNPMTPASTLLSEATDKELFLELAKRIPKPSEDVLEDLEFMETNSNGEGTDIRLNLDPADGAYIHAYFNPDGSFTEVDAVCY